MWRRECLAQYGSVYRQLLCQGHAALEVVGRHAAQGEVERPVGLERVDELPLGGVLLVDGGIEVEQAVAPHD